MRIGILFALVVLTGCSSKVAESSAGAGDTGSADTADAAAPLDGTSWCAAFAARECELGATCCTWEEGRASSCRAAAEKRCNTLRPASAVFDEAVARACLTEMSEALSKCTTPPMWSPLAAYEFRCQGVFGTKRVDEVCTSVADCKQDPAGLPITCMAKRPDGPKFCTRLAPGVGPRERCAMIDGAFVQCLRSVPCVIDPATDIGYCDPPGSSLCGGECPGELACFSGKCKPRVEDGVACGNELQCVSGVCTKGRCGWEKFPEEC